MQQTVTMRVFRGYVAQKTSRVIQHCTALVILSLICFFKQVAKAKAEGETLKAQLRQALSAKDSSGQVLNVMNCMVSLG